MLQFAYHCGRRPKSDDDFDAPVPFQEEEETEEIEEDEDIDEEVDFDRPTFKRDQIWSDYAEDLDFDQ
ncbi:hypothetical protein [Fibrobacter sp.]|uniref:hypothetical protein n=1 Tax=Fibrobacter sp. TaxID=35828 RepID=UPI00388D06BD